MKRVSNIVAFVIIIIIINFVMGLLHHIKVWISAKKKQQTNKQTNLDRT